MDYISEPAVWDRFGHDILNNYDSIKSVEEYKAQIRSSNLFLSAAEIHAVCELWGIGVRLFSDLPGTAPVEFQPEAKEQYMILHENQCHFMILQEPEPTQVGGFGGWGGGLGCVYVVVMRGGGGGGSAIFMIVFL